MTPLTIQEALKTYGGTVKFFGTNEPLADMADFLKSQPLRQVLGCCAGGDQCLTILGAVKNIEHFYAFDNNPAQLFLLAYKANLIAQRSLQEFAPSLAKICSGSKNQVSASLLHPIEITKAMNRKTHAIIPIPPSFMKKYVPVMGNTDFIDKPVYWNKNQVFLSAIRKNLPHLRFVCTDLLLLPEWFAGPSFDLIYFSDIFTPALVSKHWLARLKSLLGCLRHGGLLLGYLEFPYENTIIKFLRQNAKSFHLKELYNRNGLIILKKAGTY